MEEGHGAPRRIGTHETAASHGERDGSGRKAPSKMFFSYTRLSMRDKTFFIKRLSFLTGAGVPLLDSLRILHKQTRSRSAAKMFDIVIADVTAGSYLSDSLAKFKRAFGDFAVNIIRVGELSGILNQNLEYLADELKKKQALRAKVLGALVYPIFITVATILLTALLTVFIFPKLMPIFTSLNVTLPWTTRALIALSGFLRSYGVYLILGVIAAVIAFWFAMNSSKKFHFAVDKILLKIPIFGRLSRSYNMTNFCRTLGLLLKSGVRVNEAVNITADTTANLVYRKEMRIMADKVTRGERISKHLESKPALFPDVTPQMVAIGETTGNLSDTLIYLAELFEAEVDDATKHLSSSLEPLLMIFMGILVGLVAVSVITPIYEITQNLNP
jgi:type IV pilus assembly protein PilC